MNDLLHVRETAVARGEIDVSSRAYPGEFSAVDDPLHDRATAFAAREYHLWSRLRLFAGWEAVKTTIIPAGTLFDFRDLPRTAASRGFGGVQLRLGAQSALTLR